METKKKYKVINPIGYYGRREAGEIVEMTEGEFKAFGREYLEPVIEVATATPEKVEAGSAVKPRKRGRKPKK
jgi:hypothetical protein